MAAARHQTHHRLDPSTRVDPIRTERTWQASAANLIAPSRVLTGAVPRDQSSRPAAQRPNPLNVAEALVRVAAAPAIAFADGIDRRFAYAADGENPQRPAVIPARADFAPSPQEGRSGAGPLWSRQLEAQLEPPEGY
jgi:hypothetical protein